MKNLLLFTALACFALMGCEQELTKVEDEIQLEQRGATHFKDSGKVQFPHAVINDCNGEVVVLDGIAHYNYSQTTLPSGVIRWHYHQNFSGISGVGQDTGTVYNCVGAQSHKGEVNAGEKISILVIQNLISTGSAPSFKLKVYVVIEFDEYGNLTTYVEDVKATCK